MQHFSWHRRAMLALALTAPAWSLAQSAGSDYPQRAVKVIVPFAAGTSPDIVARYMAQKLHERTGQPFVVDNKAGAGGAIGAEAAARSSADGYTVFFMVNSIVTMNQFIYKKLAYDPAKDFAPVALVAAVPYVLLAHKQLGTNSLAGLIAKAKAAPGKIDYASAGIGGAGHVIMELMGAEAGIQLTHIPFKADGLMAVVGGQVPLMFQPTTTALAQIKKGALIGLGTTSPQRLAALPDVPSIQEVLPHFAADGWQGVMAPAGTPRPVIERLNRELQAILALPETTERFASLGINAWHSSPEKMQETIAADTAKWGKVIREARIEAQ
jgi:tripartite-type tricarboxylate transporter receptor subunit TctC